MRQTKCGYGRNRGLWARGEFTENVQALGQISPSQMSLIRKWGSVAPPPNLWSLRGAQQGAGVPDALNQ